MNNYNRWKIPLDFSKGNFSVFLPKDSQDFTVKVIGGTFYLWYTFSTVLDTTEPFYGSPEHEREFVFIKRKTGEPFVPKPEEFFLDTLEDSDGNHVWHIYYVIT